MPTKNTKSQKALAKCLLQFSCVDKPLQMETANASIDSPTAIKNSSIPMRFLILPILF